jgi:hypothetical protein
MRANIAQFFGLLLAFLLAACTTSAAPELLTTPPEPTPPEALVRQFYQEWITTEGNPIQLRAYDNTDYVTPDFIQRIDQRISEQDSIVADPLLCAQDMPTQIEVGEATITGDTARVTVQTDLVGHTFQVELVRPVKDWRINNVICPTSASATPAQQSVPTVQVNDWQTVTLNDEGMRVTFEVPAAWQPGTDPQQWTPDPASQQHIGITWGDVPPDGSGDHTLLPNHAETQLIQPLDLGWTMAELYHVARQAPAAAGGGSKALEHHAVVVVDRQGTRHAYDLYVSAPRGDLLDAVYPVFEHMLNTFALDDSAIATPPSGTAPPGSTLPLDDPGAAAPDLTSPEQTVRNFYSWYLTQANGPDAPVHDDRLWPYHEGVYQDSPYLTSDLIRQVNNRRLSPAPGDHDPLTCVPGYPQRIEVGEATTDGDTAHVPVQMHWSPGPNYETHAVQVELVRANGSWRINNVRCAADG